MSAPDAKSHKNYTERHFGNVMQFSGLRDKHYQVYRKSFIKTLAGAREDKTLLTGHLGMFMDVHLVWYCGMIIFVFGVFQIILANWLFVTTL